MVACKKRVNFVLLGIGMILTIWAVLSVGRTDVATEALKSILYPVGLTVPWRLAAAIVFWVFINSVLEEYVFRWFITSKIEQFVNGKWTAVFLSSAISPPPFHCIDFFP